MFLALLLLAPTPVWALEQVKSQQKCINQVNKNFAKVASAQGKEICDCIKRGSKDSLEGTIEECMTADAKGKVEKAQQKTLSKESKSCGTTPEFGYSSGANANDAAIAKELAIIHGIFGDNLDAVIMTEFMLKNAAKCQHAVAKQAKKCQDAKLKVFTSCKKDALKGGKSAAPVESAQQLQDACLGTGAEAMPDPKGKIQKDCVDKLGDTIDKKCISKKGVVLSDCFPLFDPNGGSTLQAFVDRIIECEACKAINQADALNRNCDLFDDGLLNLSCFAIANASECEILNATECLLPYPSSRFLTAAPTPTGFRLDFPDVGLPSVIGDPLVPDFYNELDGFNPMAAILMHFPQGLDVEASNAARLLEAGCCGQAVGPPWVDTRIDTARSLDANSPSVLIHADTGDRVLHFLELDSHAVDPNTGQANLDRQATILHPGLSLIPGERYIVAMRNLKAPGGADVEPEGVFLALRDKVITTIPEIEARRAYFESSIFPQLISAGVAREDLVLAFDFTTQSEHQLTHQMLAMRDQAFAHLAAVEADPNQINFSVENVTEFDCDDPNDDGGLTVWRDVAGTYESPLFLEGDLVDGDLDNSSVQFMNVDANDTPVQNGVMDARFDISIPCSVLLDPEDPNTPVSRPIVLGHGFFGTGEEMAQGIPKGAGEVVDWNYIAGATDWRAFSDQDFLWFGLQIIGVGQSALNNFPAHADRLRQGMLNTLVLGRMMKLGLFNRDSSAFETPDGRGVFPGASEEMYYYGISLGGIMGTFFSALTPDVERFGIDVSALAWSCIIQRSTQYIQFVLALNTIGLIDDPMHEVLFVGGLAHELWISAMPGGYARHITTDPLPGSGSPSKILMQSAWLDKQISNQCAAIQARTLGLPSLKDGSIWQGLPGIPDANGPQDSAWVMYDTGSYDILDPNFFGQDASGRSLIPQLANEVPSRTCDPHGARPAIPAGIEQLVNFLQPGGQVENFCNGLCDAGDPDETANGNPPCDPLQ
ncbi:MAG: hypothetical protein E2O71_03900 [Deltaproteobacteria bacterium]|nr:MAG: hypothetical protein E2O71_03900 [Deltaproteobacteria bacterium]